MTAAEASRPVSSQSQFLAGKNTGGYLTTGKDMKVQSSIYSQPKGQLISKADLCVADSPKKRTNEFVFFLT